jgi:hypothetical protein
MMGCWRTKANKGEGGARVQKVEKLARGSICRNFIAIKTMLECAWDTFIKKLCISHCEVVGHCSGKALFSQPSKMITALRGMVVGTFRCGCSRKCGLIKRTSGTIVNGVAKQ